MEGWSLDLITNLAPTTEEGFKHCLVCVDCFSKFVEIFPLKSKSSKEVSIVFYREIVARYGKPKWVRVDAGREFEGEFIETCKTMGIHKRVASSGYPRSNG